MARTSDTASGDEDTIDDSLEVGLFKTSPLLADTNGDGLSDDRELFELARDPRIADLPRPRITIGQVRLQLDERYTYVDQTGETVSVNSSTSSALQSSNSSKFGRSDTRNWGTGGEGYIKGGGKVGYEKGVTWEINAEGGYKWTSHDDNSMQVTSESESATQAAFESALQRGRELSTSTTVTREVLGARIDIDVIIESAGDIAFTLSNLELTLLQPSLLTLGDAEVVASLVPSRELTSGNEAVFNLGPLIPERGPIVFSNTEVFPSLVEELMRSPRGLLFRIANYDLTDEFGRNFAFASQEARDRCVGIVIDRGDDDPERVLVALNGQIDTNGFVAQDGFLGGFDDAGRRRGVPKDYVLQDLLNLEKNRRTPNGILAGLNFRADSVVAGDDLEIIPRGTAGLLPHDVVISAGANGILESSPGDDDRLDVITGYETSPTCGRETPDQIIEPLTGGDGVVSTLATDDDVQLVAFGASATPGTPMIAPGPDGVVDSFPGGDDLAVFPGQIAKPSAIADDGDGVADTEALGDDVQLVPVGTTGLANRTPIVGPGPNGFIDTPTAGDDVFVSADCGGAAADGQEILVRFENRRSGEFQRTWAFQIDRAIQAGGDFGAVMLYPGDDIGLAFVQDVDNDGVLAQIEFVYGSSDTLDDTDDDGLDDFVEISVGWTVGVQGAPLTKVFPNPSVPDSDGDGLTDYEEQNLSRYVTNAAVFTQIYGVAPNPDQPIATIPRLADSDGDGISDKEELDGYIIGHSIRAGANEVANSEALGDDVQKVFVGSAVNNTAVNGGIVILPGPNRVIDSVATGDDFLDVGRVVWTNPLDPDHDGDTRVDGLERDLGGDPTNTNDPDDFRDTDRDGLSDAEEEDLGWTVTVFNGAGQVTSRFVTSTSTARNCNGPRLTRGAWFTYTPTCDGPITLNVCPDSNNLTELTVFTGDCSDLTCVANDVSLTQVACPENPHSLTFEGIAGETYRICFAFVFTSGEQLRTGTITLLSSTPNDACADATPINAGDSVAGTTECATSDSAPPSTCGTITHDVWYTYTPSCHHVLDIDTCGSSVDNILSLYNGTCGSLTEIACNDDDDICVETGNARLRVPVISGTTYRIRVGTPTGTVGGPYMLNLAPSGAHDGCLNAEPIGVGQNS
ncbi:MAG: hypothetical protein AB7N71_09530, partial [Phycisphaerae bacterium]